MSLLKCMPVIKRNKIDCYRIVSNKILGPSYKTLQIIFAIILTK